MSDLRRRLLETLRAAIDAAPVADQERLLLAVRAYTTTYHRSVDAAGPLLRSLLETIEEAAHD